MRPSGLLVNAGHQIRTVVQQHQQAIVHLGLQGGQAAQSISVTTCLCITAWVTFNAHDGCLTGLTKAEKED